jgi:hypothetical protein
MPGKITGDILEARLKCKYKAHLKLAGDQGEPHDYERLLKESREHVRACARHKRIARHPGQEVPSGLPLTADLLKRGLPLLLDVPFEDDDLSVRGASNGPWNTFTSPAVARPATWLLVRPSSQ